MEFKIFYSLLFKRIGDTLTSGEFVRDLIAMITSVPEDEWKIKKDPSNRVSLKTYENFAKRGINKTTCKAIMYRLTPDNFIESLNNRPPAILKILAEDLLPYDSSATSENVATLLADIFINIIRTTAGLVSPNSLEKQKQIQSSIDLKTKYGKYLLQECSNYCPMNNCGKLLFVSNGLTISDVYEVSKIDKSKNSNVDNIIALCPNCFATYQIDTSKTMTKELTKIKKALSSRMQSMIDLDTIQLEKGLTNVIIQLKKLKETDLFALTMDPKELVEKIDKSTDIHLYLQVNNYVITYFVTIREILKSLDKQQKIDFEDLQNQMKAAYKKLRKTKKSKLEIFTSLSERIHKVTMQEMIFCQAIVCYFIQSCEVFDAIT